jgi:hypothetical protein
MKYIKNTKTMLYKSKLKGSFGRIYPISLIIIYILCLIEIFIRWQIRDIYFTKLVPQVSFFIAGLFFIGMGIIQLKRYKLWIFPVLGLFAGIGCILAVYVVPGPPKILGIFYFINLLIIILLIVTNWSTLSSQERYESNARRLFKLAVEVITETSNGYTHRPFAAGKITINREELLGFARFINGKFIARSIYQKDSVYLIFSMNKSVLKVNDPLEVSYFEINEPGEVSVKIAERDYQKYKDTFNFNQLSEKMAQVFLRFLDYYKSGNENRILTELKTAR